MKIDQTADAVIIGGGILGASVAHFLSKKGVGKVILLEKRGLASESTGNSAANIRTAYSNPLTIRLALRSLEMFENDEEELGGKTNFRRTGMMALLGEKHLRSGLMVLEQEQTLNTGTRQITIEESQELAPKFNFDGLITATYQSRAGYANPVLTTKSLVNSAIEKWGLKLYEGVSAVGVEIQNSKSTGVQTDKGLIKTPIIINAAGPWGVEIGKWVNKNHSIRWSKEGDLVLKLPEGFGSFPIIADPICRIYFRPHYEGMLLVGRDYPKEIEPLDINNFENGLDDNTQIRMMQGLNKRIPSIKYAKYYEGWSSIYTISDDWHPLVGQEREIQGFYTCFAGSGHSFKLGPPIGESLADVVVGDKPKIDITDLRPSRFEDGESFTSAWGSGNRA